VRSRELQRFPGHVSGFVPVWAQAVWAALRFVPSCRPIAFSRFWLVFSFLIRGWICSRCVSQSFRESQKGQSPRHFAEMAQKQKKSAAKLKTTKPKIAIVVQSE
jgi:hypothetical protein